MGFEKSEYFICTTSVAGDIGNHWLIHHGHSHWLWENIFLPLCYQKLGRRRMMRWWSSLRWWNYRCRLAVLHELIRGFEVLKYSPLFFLFGSIYATDHKLYCGKNNIVDIWSCTRAATLITGPYIAENGTCEASQHPNDPQSRNI